MNNVDYPPSYYAASANWHQMFPTLEGNHNVDVCILGAGITGLSAAVHLAEAGYRVAVLEARRVGWGGSGRSGGQFIFGYGCEQGKIEAMIGREASQRLWDASLEGIDLIREHVERYHIDCDLVQGHAHLALKPRHMRELEAWSEDLAGYGYRNLTLWDRAQVRKQVASDRYIGGLYDPNSGHLHPLNYTFGLARAAGGLSAQIFEMSPVLDIQQGDKLLIKSERGQVSANFCVLAGNAYLSNLMPAVEAKVMPVGTYITATEPLGTNRYRDLIANNCAIADMNFVLDYFRCSGDQRLLFGGRVSYSTLPPLNLEAAMRKRLLAVFPQLRGIKLDYTWGGYVAITANRAPHFGRVGNNIYFAQGFSGHGIAATGLAGKLIAEAIAGQAEKFDLFTRLKHLSFPGGALFRTPALVLAMTWFRLRDLLP